MCEVIKFPVQPAQHHNESLIRAFEDAMAGHHTGDVELVGPGAARSEAFFIPNVAPVGWEDYCDDIQRIRNGCALHPAGLLNEWNN